MENRIVCRNIELLAGEVWPMVQRELGRQTGHSRD